MRQLSKWDKWKRIKEAGTWYDEYAGLWHVPCWDKYVTDPNQESYYSGHGNFVDVVENVDSDELTYLLDIKTGDTVELVPWDINEWLVYNKRNNFHTVVSNLSTGLGADDGHCDFSSGWVYLFNHIPNVTFVISRLIDGTSEDVYNFVENGGYASCLWYGYDEEEE